MHQCPACGGTAFKPSVTPAAMRREIQLRRDFVVSRLGRKAAPSELKDLTEFMHGFPAALMQCYRCGLLMRVEKQPALAANSYEDDPNDTDLMAQLLPRYVEAFRQKQTAYRQLLRPDAEVLEVGSHLGAFLIAAEEWNWRPRGVDVGRDTVEFQKRQRLSVRRQTVEEVNFPTRDFDAVFVWNCFEQLRDPAATLAGIHRLLAPYGLLVVRVPNADFYSVLRRKIEPDDDSDPVMQALAYNNLLGFPYLYGHTADSLTRLVCGYGFEDMRAFNSELVTMPFADLNRRIAEEQKIVSRAVAAWSLTIAAQTGRLSGPWIELVFRKVEEPAWKERRRRKDPGAEARWRSKIDLRFLRRAA